jgi:hypothetical protein
MIHDDDSHDDDDDDDDRDSDIPRCTGRLKVLFGLLR